ncbi:hypothetical protein CYMTET_50817 [Cymbomonas tetramitiformis]|uniref:PH domain-containing protein n=1 Tax=Cymbomonas tetramitiformis TaxID=36881 RepID=A0AAE0ESF9_9CHLO|nr:hypothetical protein CYMTET_50817 [Cymbomonas tetramitiformis]
MSVIPPVDHPFWKEPDAPAQAIAIVVGLEREIERLTAEMDRLQRARGPTGGRNTESCDRAQFAGAVAPNPNSDDKESPEISEVAAEVEPAVAYVSHITANENDGEAPGSQHSLDEAKTAEMGSATFPQKTALEGTGTLWFKTKATGAKASVLGADTDDTTMLSENPGIPRKSTAKRQTESVPMGPHHSRLPEDNAAKMDVNDSARQPQCAVPSVKSGALKDSGSRVQASFPAAASKGRIFVEDIPLPAQTSHALDTPAAPEAATADRGHKRKGLVAGQKLPVLIADRSDEPTTLQRSADAVDAANSKPRVPSGICPRACSLDPASAINQLFMEELLFPLGSTVKELIDSPGGDSRLEPARSCRRSKAHGNELVEPPGLHGNKPVPDAWETVALSPRGVEDALGGTSRMLPGIDTEAMTKPLGAVPIQEPTRDAGAVGATKIAARTSTGYTPPKPGNRMSSATSASNCEVAPSCSSAGELAAACNGDGGPTSSLAPGLPGDHIGTSRPPAPSAPSTKARSSSGTTADAAEKPRSSPRKSLDTVESSFSADLAAVCPTLFVPTPEPPSVNRADAPRRPGELRAWFTKDPETTYGTPRRRYFVLNTQQTVLSYYENEGHNGDGEVLKGSIKVEDMVSVRTQGAALIITISSGRVYLLTGNDDGSSKRFAEALFS